MARDCEDTQKWVDMHLRCAVIIYPPPIVREGERCVLEDMLKLILL